MESLRSSTADSQRPCISSETALPHSSDTQRKYVCVCTRLYITAHIINLCLHKTVCMFVHDVSLSLTIVSPRLRIYIYFRDS